MLAVGIDAGRNKYLLGGYCHKMGLAERWQKLSGLWKFWSQMPGVQIVKVGYERYGLMDALEHFEERQLLEKIGFEIIELAWPSEGGNAKYDRIQRLEPDYRAGKWWFAGAYEPEVAVCMTCQQALQLVPGGGKCITADCALKDIVLPVAADTRNQRMVREAGQSYRIFEPARQKDHEGNLYSLNKLLFDEYICYPYSAKDDALDCQSRIYDMDPVPPVILDGEFQVIEDFVDGG